jgi:GntR family transcriptional regulator
MPDFKWRQIADDLRRRIESGEIGHGGEPLPTELELQEQYEASRNTIRDAVRWLVTRGLIYTRSGQGTFVTARIDPFVTKLVPGPGSSSEAETPGFATEVINRQRKPEVSRPRVEIVRAEGLPAAELHLNADDMVISRHQQRLIDGVPYSRQTTFYPLQLVQRGATRLINAEDIEGGGVAYVEAALSIIETGARDQIAVRLPDQEETAFFSLPDDGRISVIEIIRTGYAATGEPFRVTVTTYPADRNQFVMSSGSVPDDLPAPARQAGPPDRAEK